MNMKKIQLHWQILIALVLAILWGVLLTDYVYLVEWMGVLFLRALKMIIIPLIFSSIVTGVANIGDAENLGRLGIKTFGYYLTTSALAIITGLFFVNLLKPGVGAELGFSKMVDGLSTARDSFGDILINIIPTNIFEALTNGNILPIIFFAMLFGFFITRIESKPKRVLSDFFNSLFDVVMKITMFIIKFTPLGILGIVAKVVAEQANDADAIIAIGGRLGLYMITVILALGVHFGITLPIILKFVGKVNPIKQLKAMRTALLTAFSTSSSSATLPLTMESIENNSGVSNKVTSFVLPLGATVNMDGTALYECVAAMFIAQAYGVELGFFQQIIVVITALLASIGAAGIPMAGLVMISVILTAVGLPLEGIGLILAVDRILDMLRTTTNVWSDGCGAVVIANSEGEKLKVQ
jgi:Na+/H+-dicarboxylate symporter